MKPLLPNPKRAAEAALFHRAVFAEHGRACWNCRKDATDACHVIPRALLGKHRYAMPKRNGRPGCRPCHLRQEAGEIEFPLAVRRTAVRSLNTILKVPIAEPTR